MAITNKAELQTAVTTWLGDDSSGITDNFDDFIVLTENILNFGMLSDQYNLEPLRTRDMEAASTLTSASGIVTLPDTFLEARRVVELASIRRPLEYITPEMADYMYPDWSGGQASHYTVIGSSLYTFPLTSNDIEVQHYRTIPPLADNEPNWLLTKAPNVYLRGVLMQAALLDRDDNEATKQAMMFKALVDGMNASSNRASYVNAGVYLGSVTP